jgi:DNA-binding MarR family transcriptional regulator
MSNKSKSELIEAVRGRFRTMGVVNDLFDAAAARRLGVNRTDLRVMDFLHRAGPMPISRLADLNQLSRPAMTTVVDRLEQAGYARRVRDSEDRRSVLVELTPLAQERAWEIYGPFTDISETEFKRYTADELELFDRFLAHSTEVTERHLETILASGQEEPAPSAAPE